MRRGDIVNWTTRIDQNRRKREEQQREEQAREEDERLQNRYGRTQNGEK